jgi:hypothetical protein
VEHIVPTVDITGNLELIDGSGGGECHLSGKSLEAIRRCFGRRPFSWLTRLLASQLDKLSLGHATFRKK